MCLQCAARPWLTFEDFNHREVNHIKNCVLYSTRSKPSASNKSSGKHSLTRSSEKPSFSKQAPSKRKGRKNKSTRMSLPYDLKDSIIWDISDQPCDLWNASLCPCDDKDFHIAHNA